MGGAVADEAVDGAAAAVGGIGAGGSMQLSAPSPDGCDLAGTSRETVTCKRPRLSQPTTAAAATGRPGAALAAALPPTVALPLTASAAPPSAEPASCGGSIPSSLAAAEASAAGVGASAVDDGKVTVADGGLRSFLQEVATTVVRRSLACEGPRCDAPPSAPPRAGFSWIDLTASFS